MDSSIFQGYRRENGRVGIRNHVVILPVDDISNAACEAVANNIKGTLALPHAYGRLQFGEDLELFFRTLIGVGANPNVAAAVVIVLRTQLAGAIAPPLERFATRVAGPMASFGQAVLDAFAAAPDLSGRTITLTDSISPIPIPLLVSVTVACLAVAVALYKASTLLSE